MIYYLRSLMQLIKKLEEKWADLGHTFGKKPRFLKMKLEILQMRDSLTKKIRRPLYRKGGQVVKYTALLACGNYHGAVGFGKAIGPAVPVALQKATGNHNR